MQRFLNITISSFTINMTYFNAVNSPFVHCIKCILYHINTHGINVEFLWVLDHAGISGNEMTDGYVMSPILEIPYSDFLINLKTITSKYGKINVHQQQSIFLSGIGI